jgi:FAD:protein FMN transferase
VTLVVSHAATAMDTVVTIRVVSSGSSDDARARLADDAATALAWFHEVECTCSRFDPASELRRLCDRAGDSVLVSPMLLETTRFALSLAAESDGAFDPTVGARMAARGFDREHRTGARSGAVSFADESASFRDVLVDEAEHTITLAKPLLLDLGAVAKGFAVDLAAHHLRACGHDDFVVNAGGDLYAAGRNERGEPWSIGIRHPRGGGPRDIIESLTILDAALCTSGDYERATPAGHHILDPRLGDSAGALASVSVIAPRAMLADGLATAAFVLGPERGLELVRRHGASAVLYSPALVRFCS